MADRALQTSDFPEPLRRRLKAIAAIRGIDMRVAVIEAVTSWCNEHDGGLAAVTAETRTGAGDD